MRITVTQDDIDNGFRGTACACPVARAVGRAFGVPPLVNQVSVGWSIGIRQSPADRYMTWYALPDVADDFIRKFDTKQPVEPFAFELGEEL
jgi:hypothetical protein